MSKKIFLILFLIIGLIISGSLIFNLKNTRTSLSNPVVNQKETSKKSLPSNSYKDYLDPSGFTFNYPDNLSITNNEITDNSTYTDIELSSKEVNGSIIFKITDSKYKSIDEWVKLSKFTSTKSAEVNLGNLKAIEIQANDRLFLGALDQGIFFNIEMPLIEKDFWMIVYNKILESFSFANEEIAAEGGNTNTFADDVVFEGEEVVE